MNTLDTEHASADPVVATGRILQALAADGVDVADDDRSLRTAAALTAALCGLADVAVAPVRGSDVVLLRGMVRIGRRAALRRSAAGAASLTLEASAS